MLSHCGLLNKTLLIDGLLAALCLPCFVQVLSSCGKQGRLFLVEGGLLLAVASLVAEYGL